MFEQRTAFILGAGASWDFGFPLGPQLIENIIEGINEALREVDRTPEGQGNFISAPYISLIRFCESFGVDRDISCPSRRGLEELARSLDYASHQSIDDFARTNPSKRDLVKILVALEIGKATFDEKEFQQGRLAQKLSIFQGSRRKWYGQLVTKLRDDCASPAECEGYPVDVITFNYDRSLEAYLQKAAEC